MSVLELAREGTNTACVDCGDRPLFGGMRCLDCFHVRVQERADVYEAGHVCKKHAHPLHVCYIKCKCRCAECRAIHSDYCKSRGYGRKAAS